MKFLFVAPRYHTNQIPIVKQLIDKGHKVVFCSQRLGKSEDYKILKPYLMKKSTLTVLVYKLIDFKYSSNNRENLKTRMFIPRITELYKKIKIYQPEVVIIRDLNITSVLVYFVCKLLKIKSVVFYDQSPLLSVRNLKLDFKGLIKEICTKLLLPKVRITPVYSNNIYQLRNNKENYYIKEKSYFVPFIADSKEDIAERTYLYCGDVNILSVGKYRDYKNHFLLVDAIALLKNKNNLNVSIVGQVSNEEEKRYYNSLNCYIKKKKLENKIFLKKNIDYSKMSSIYQKNDIFVLTSKVEIASVSVLEAMGNGLVTFSTNANGTASYINDGECGYLFRTMNARDLASKIEKTILQKEGIPRMGRKAWENTKKNYSPQSYYIALGEVLSKEFGINLEA